MYFSVFYFVHFYFPNNLHYLETFIPKVRSTLYDFAIGELKFKGISAWASCTTYTCN